MNVLIPLIALALAGWLAFSKRLSGSSLWQATLTPLASIMGSGFLISAPLLGGLVGKWAFACMMVLLVVAYLVGWAIRFNIRHFEPVEHEKGAVQTAAFLSRIVLVGAYFISVVYYLELLAAFTLKQLGLGNGWEADLVATVLLLVIGLVGSWKGLSSLEKVEEYAVSVNLGMIGALLVSLVIYNITLGVHGEWKVPSVDSSVDGHDLRVLLGLLIVVQGFETSRYLGVEHPAEDRIRTMRYAQLLSGVIYVVFVALATILFRNNMGGDVTAILQLTKDVAFVLPFFLTIAAIGSQFSAAVADTAGAGGLIEDITNEKIPERWAYLGILAVTVALVWLVDVNQVIALASRAFALFYAIQCLVAAMMAIHDSREKKTPVRCACFGVLALVCLGVVIFGIPAES